MTVHAFNLGMLIVDDDSDIVDQHQLLITNRVFRKQTPGRLYRMLRDVGLIEADATIDAILQEGKWPSERELAHVLSINPELDAVFSIVDIDVAYDVDTANGLWQRRKGHYLGDRPGCYIAILDYDMPDKTGLELADEWRPFSENRRGRVTTNSPLIIFYTGKAPLLQHALREDGHDSNFGGIAATGLAEAVLLKGALRDEYNQLIWRVIQDAISKQARSTTAVDR